MTVADVIADLRERARLADRLGPDSMVHNSAVADYLRDAAKRLDEAYKSQLTEGKMCTMSCREDGRLLEQYAESEKRLVADVKRYRSIIHEVQELAKPSRRKYKGAFCEQIHNLVKVVK